MVMRALIIFSLATLTSVAGATPPDTYGFGVRSTALAGAVSADVGDPSANYHNPAGLARGTGVRFSLGYMTLNPKLSINGGESSVERFGAVQVGLIAPVNIDDVTVAFGLGLILPDQRLARTRSVIVDRPRWELYDTRSHRLFLAANLAIRPVKWLTLGAGIAFQAPSVLTLDVEGTLNLNFPEESSRLRHQFEGDLTSTRYPQAGAQFHLHERFSLGVTYRGKYELRNTIIALANARVSVATLNFALETISTSLFGPQQLSLSTAITPIDRLRIGLEVTWMDWSQHTSLISSNDISLELDPAIVAIPAEITSLEPRPPGLHDVFVPRVSIEGRAVETESVELDVRAGYAYEDSPFPEQTGITNFVDGDKHHMSVGLGLRLVDLDPVIDGFLGFDAYFLWTHVPTREHRKDSAVDPVGDYFAGGNIFGGGIQMELAFE